MIFSWLFLIVWCLRLSVCLSGLFVSSLVGVTVIRPHKHRHRNIETFCRNICIRHLRSLRTSIVRMENEKFSAVCSVWLGVNATRSTTLSAFDLRTSQARKRWQRWCWCWIHTPTNSATLLQQVRRVVYDSVVYGVVLWFCSSLRGGYRPVRSQRMRISWQFVRINKFSAMCCTTMATKKHRRHQEGVHKCVDLMHIIASSEWNRKIINTYHNLYLNSTCSMRIGRCVLRVYAASRCDVHHAYKFSTKVCVETGNRHLGILCAVPLATTRYSNTRSRMLDAPFMNMCVCMLYAGI